MISPPDRPVRTPDLRSKRTSDNERDVTAEGDRPGQVGMRPVVRCDGQNVFVGRSGDGGAGVASVTVNDLRWNSERAERPAFEITHAGRFASRTVRPT
jgi:hypothetical protein